MTEAYIADIFDRLLAETQSWATRGERSRALLRAIAGTIQAWEDMRFDLEFSTRLDNATREFLEQWGELVDEKRGNLTDDDEYRRIIRARIQANRANAQTNDPIDIARTLFKPADQWFVPLHPADYRIEFTPDRGFSDAFIQRAVDVMERSRPAGVGQSIVKTPPSNILRLQDTEKSFDGPQMSDRIL